MGAQTIPVTFEITGEKKEIKESIGEECWVSEEQKCPLYYDQFSWNQKFNGEERWYKGGFPYAYEICQMEKKLLQMQWRRQSRCKWISMYRRSTM